MLVLSASRWAWVVYWVAIWGVVAVVALALALALAVVVLMASYCRRRRLKPGWTAKAGVGGL